MQSLKNYALKYAEKGFYVLPVERNDKRPMIEFADQPAMDSGKIDRFWTRHPTAQIAFRTVDFIVVDIDNHTDGANGMESFQNFKSEHPECFTPTLTQTTHSGGRQLFYRKPKDVEMTQVIGWLPGVDIKAHINNYAVVAPSMGAKGHYHWDNSLPIAECPPELFTAITRNQGVISHNFDYKRTGDDFEPLSDSDKQFGSHSKTAELFEQIVNGLGETGGRNMALASFVGGLLFRNVDSKVVYELSMQANEKTAKPLDSKEFDRTFDSMVKKEMRRRNA